METEYEPPALLTASVANGGAPSPTSVTATQIPGRPAPFVLVTLPVTLPARSILALMPVSVAPCDTVSDVAVDSVGWPLYHWGR